MDISNKNLPFIIGEYVYTNNEVRSGRSGLLTAVVGEGNITNIYTKFRFNDPIREHEFVIALDIGNNKYKNVRRFQDQVFKTKEAAETYCRLLNKKREIDRKAREEKRRLENEICND